LEIDADDFGINGFTIEYNGISQFYSSYDPNNAYTIGDVGTCDDDLIVTIIDEDDPNCKASFNYGPLCCLCQFYYPEFYPEECEGDLFNMVVDLSEVFGSCKFYDWKIIVDGVDYILENANNDDLWDAFDIETSLDSLVTFELCSLYPMVICENYTIENPCFDSSANCEIFNITAYADTDSCEDDMVDIIFELDAEDFGVFGFTVSDGSATETFDPGDDFVFKTANNCSVDIELTFTDLNKPSCYASTIFTPECCDCSLENLLATPAACDNGSFDISVDFNILSGSCNYDSWYISVDGLNYDLVYNGNSYDGNNILATDSTVTAMVCTLAPSGECFTVDFNNPCYVPVNNSNCIITSFIPAYDSTSCVGEIINIDFDFNATDFGANGFNISTAGVTQFYNLGDDYTFSFIAECDTSVTVTITDVENPNCNAAVTLGPACCDCDISDPVLETTDCENGLFDLHLGFDVNQGSCVNYDWYVTIDSVNYDLLYNTTDDFYQASDILATDSLLTIMLCNESPLNECYTYTIANPCFEDNSNTVCAINTFTATYDTNSCVGEIISIDFLFDAAGFGLNGFEVSSDGYTQFYNLGDDYSIGIITLCEEDIELTITDIDNPNCTATVTLAPACCPCVFEDVELKDPVCENGTFDLRVLMIIESGSCINYDWYTNINGSSYDLIWDGDYLVAEDVYSIDSLLTIFVCTESPIYDCTVFNIENPCYQENIACKINSFTATVDSISCDSLGNVLVSFDYDIENEGSLGYSIAVNGVVQDTMVYPGGIEFLVPSNCDSMTTFTFQDIEFPNCNATTVVDVCCTAGVSCMIQQLTIDALQSNDNIKLVINLLVDDTCPTTYNVSVNGESYGLHDINTPDYIIDDVVSSEEILNVFVCNELYPEFCENIKINNPIISNTSNIISDDIKIVSDQSGNMVITNNSANNLDFIFWSIQGQKISSTALASGKTKITSLNNITDGIYILQFLASDGNYLAKKIIVINSNLR